MADPQTTIHAGLAAGYHCAATAGENLSCYWPDCGCVSDDEIKSIDPKRRYICGDSLGWISNGRTSHE